MTYRDSMLLVTRGERWELSICDKGEAARSGLAEGEPVYRRVPVEEQTLAEQPLDDNLLRSIRRLQWGRHESALDFLARYNDWSLSFRDGSSPAVVSAAAWWAKAAPLQRALWLFDLVTTEMIDAVDDYCIKEPSPIGDRIVDICWPDNLVEAPDYLAHPLKHGYENEVVYIWRVLAEHINTYTPPNQTVLDWDESAGRLCEYPAALTLEGHAWQLLRSRILKTKPIRRCRYCKKPILNATRVAQYCIGSDACKQGGRRKYGRVRKRRTSKKEAAK